jgi:uncharacterized membrane protein
MRLARSAFFGLVAVLGIQGIASYSRLPGTLASHFDAAGAPNGYQSKPVFFIFFVGLIVLATLFAYGVPALIAARPESTNLPHKERWLAPDRRADALGFLSGHFTWLACAMLLLGNVLFFALVRFNSGSRGTAPSGLFLALVVGFVLFTAWWITRLYKRLSA